MAGFVDYAGGSVVSKTLLDKKAGTLTRLPFRPGVAARDFRCDPVAVSEIARVDGEGAAIRQTVNVVEPAGRVAIRMELESAALVRDQVAADTAAAAIALASRQALADVAGTEHIEEESPEDAAEEDQADAERLRGK
jgi:hypothetical protein